MNLNKNDKIVAVLGVVILVVAAVGIFFLYDGGNNNDNNDQDQNKVEGYTVEWTKQTKEMNVLDKQVMKGSPLEDSFPITAPVDGIITNVNIHISWQDGRAPLNGLLGKDDVSVVITPKDGGEEKTLSGKGSGNDTFTYSINSVPSDETLDVASYDEAVESVETQYSLSDSVSFDYKVNVAKGGLLNLLDYLLDKGEVVTIKVTYDVYTYSVVEPSEEPDDVDDLDDGRSLSEQMALSESIREMGSGFGTFY